ncbi:TPA: Cro/CI family transcriptional regulator [Aeromonas hydrophila]|uniref:Cro/CI family transcriptional regulator n=1 Tax=Aeromonas TaxID=642 RepID=UPI0028905FC1|nr:Cro/Cl family transcriptional regulator [Aeromonas hydrophila]
MNTADAIAHFGGIAPLAKALGVKTQAISQWKERVPELRSYQIEVLTGGKLKASARSTPQQPTPCV